MKTISVCMIVKNEQEVIERILKSVSKFADEIIVVDTGSIDETVNLSKKYTQNVFSYKWNDDFSAARNFSFSKGTSDYLMWLDADDVISDESVELLLNLKYKLTNEDVVMLPYQTAFDENGNVSFWYYRERLLKNNSNFVWCDPVHEVIVPNGKIVYENIPIKHCKIKQGDPFRNLKIYQKIIKEGVKLSPRQLFYYANELYYNRLFDEAICIYEKFLKDGGMIDNVIQACLNLSKIYKIKGDRKKALQILFGSFMYSTPKAEVLCEIGGHFLELKDYASALFWYEKAISDIKPKTSGFIVKDCYGYVPYVQMGLCSYYLKDYENAIKYNDLALEIKPYSKICQKNKEYYILALNNSSNK